MVLGAFIYFKNSAINSVDRSSQPQACLKSGFLSLAEYLPSYTVKTGDTLLWVAEKKIGDSSRVEELIKLNKDTYPQLSSENFILEQGWKLKLPPENVGKTNGIIIILGGRVSMNQAGWNINWRNEASGPFELSQLSKSIADGDCVIAIFQGNDKGNPLNIKVLSITKQK